MRENPYYGLIHDKVNGYPVTFRETGFSRMLVRDYLHNAMLYSDELALHHDGVKFNLRVIAPANPATGSLIISTERKGHRAPFKVDSAGRWDCRRD